jgi:uncharacterized protein YjiS (DUF1127 family)
MYGYSQDPLRMSSAQHGLRSASSFLAQAQATCAHALRWVGSTWLVRAFANVAAERRARNAMLELGRWDDHMLRDVGLERMDIEAAIRGERNQAYQWEPDSDPAKLRRLQNLHRG